MRIAVDKTTKIVDVFFRNYVEMIVNFCFHFTYTRYLTASTQHVKVMKTARVLVFAHDLNVHQEENFESHEFSHLTTDFLSVFQLRTSAEANKFI